MKILELPLPDNHVGIAELDDDDVILYIEEPTKILFGLLKGSSRCTHFEVFTLSDKDDDRGITIDRMIHGYFSRYPLRYRNMETFEPKIELIRMWAAYQKDKAAKEQWEKRLKSFQDHVQM